MCLLFEDYLLFFGYSISTCAVVSKMFRRRVGGYRDQRGGGVIRAGMFLRGERLRVEGGWGDVTGGVRWRSGVLLRYRQAWQTSLILRQFRTVLGDIFLDVVVGLDRYVLLACDP